MGGPGSGPKAKAKSSVPLKALSINSLLFGGEKKVVDLRKRPREDDQAELTDQADAVAPQAAQEAAASVAPQAGSAEAPVPPEAVLDAASAVAPQAAQEAPASVAPQAGEGQGRERPTKRSRQWSAVDAGRKFNQLWLRTFLWLRVSASGKAYCEWCSTTKQGNSYSDAATGAINKADNLRKHEASEGHKKAEKAYRLLKLQDTGRQINIEKQLQALADAGDSKKAKQVLVIYHLLSQGRPMTDYESMYALLNVLGAEGLPDAHWGDDLGWDIAACLDKVLLDDLREAIRVSDYGSVMIDDSTTVTTDEMMSVEVQFVTKGVRRECFAELVHVPITTAAALHTALVKVLTETLAIPELRLRTWLVGFGADGASVNMGKVSGIATLLKMHTAPAITAIHCHGHRGALVAKAAEKDAHFLDVREVLKDLYSFFSRSAKRGAALNCHQELLHIAKLKILPVYEVRWLEVHKALRNALRVWPALLNFLHEWLENEGGEAQPAGARRAAKHLYDRMIDAEVVLTSVVYVPLLEAMQAFLCACQRQDACVFEISAHLQELRRRLQADYLDPATRFKFAAWEEQRDFGLLAATEDERDTQTKKRFAVEGDGNTAQVYLDATYSEGADALSHTGQRHKLLKTSQMPDGVSQSVWVGKFSFELSLEAAEDRAIHTVKDVIDQLAVRFPRTELLEAFEVLSPAFWQTRENNSAAFIIKAKQKLRVLEAQYGQAQAPIIQVTLLHQQWDSFEVLMTSKSQGIKDFWSDVFASTFVAHDVSEFCKLAQVMLVLPVGSVANERAFSTMNQLKSKLRNRMETKHLNICMRAKRCEYKLHEVPVKKVVTVFKQAKSRRMLNK